MSDALSRIPEPARRAAKQTLARLGLRVVRADALSLRLERAVAGCAIDWPARALRDDLVELRPLRDGDIEAFVRAGNDEAVRFMAGWRHPFTADDARRWMADQQAMREAGLTLALVVATRTEDAFAGLVQLHRLDLSNRRGSLGLWTAPEHRGRGLMRHALPLFLSWLFESRLLDRVEYLTRADNAASLALARSCGFTEEGLLRSCLVRAQERHDAVLLSALREEWRPPEPRGSSTAAPAASETAPQAAQIHHGDAVCL